MEFCLGQKQLFRSHPKTIWKNSKTSSFEYVRNRTLFTFHVIELNSFQILFFQKVISVVFFCVIITNDGGESPDL